MSTCPRCGDNKAYVGFTTVECLNRSCNNFSETWWRERGPRSTGLSAELKASGPMPLHSIRSRYGTKVFLRILREALDPGQVLSGYATIEFFTYKRHDSADALCWKVSDQGYAYYRDASDPDTWYEVIDS